MRLIESLKKKKIVLFNILAVLYIGTNLIGGDRGLISYFKKNEIHNKLINEEMKLEAKLKNLDHKIKLINNNNFDYLDMLYREKLKFGGKEEIIIKLK